LTKIRKLSKNLNVINPELEVLFGTMNFHGCWFLVEMIPAWLHGISEMINFSMKQLNLAYPFHLLQITPKNLF